MNGRVILPRIQAGLEMDGIGSLWFSLIHLSHDLRQQLRAYKYVTDRALWAYHASFQTERSRMSPEYHDSLMEEHR